ncbi:MAG: hypothetical protein JST11_14970 [Acidobacteria bacterium]|nr:hypothetical protein [Acidobacteriota bacterium]
MTETTFQGRRAASIENDRLRVTVLAEGGHIAEIFHKPCGVNPLWVPPWPSIEPSAFRPGPGNPYGDGIEAKLLSGIMGHNLCLDVFGGPSEEEAAAGLGVHGESSVNAYAIEAEGDGLVMDVTLPLAGLRFDRRISLDGETVRIREAVENGSATDRPIAWTHHVTLGPPFLAKGATRFLASATRSKTFEGAFGAHDYLAPDTEFDWPMAPRIGGGEADLRVFTDAPRSSAFTTHMMDQGREEAYFAAWSPASRLLFGYVWKSADFPWLAIWEENLSRTHAPWNGRAITRGMEFGVSPMAETRRRMIDRGKMFGVPCYRWIPARTRVEVEYRVVTREAPEVEGL